MLCKYLSYWDKKEPFSSSLHRDENTGKKNSIWYNKYQNFELKIGKHPLTLVNLCKRDFDAKYYLSGENSSKKITNLPPHVSKMSTSLLPFPSLSPFPSETRIFGDFRFAYLPPTPDWTFSWRTWNFFGTSDSTTVPQITPTPILEHWTRNFSWKTLWRLRCYRLV